MQFIYEIVYSIFIFLFRLMIGASVIIPLLSAWAICKIDSIKRNSYGQSQLYLLLGIAGNQLSMLITYSFSTAPEPRLAFLFFRTIGLGVMDTFIVIYSLEMLGLLDVEKLKSRLRKLKAKGGPRDATAEPGNQSGSTSGTASKEGDSEGRMD